MEELKHDADLLAAQARQGLFAQRGDVDAVDEHLPGGRSVQTGQQAEQG